MMLEGKRLFVIGMLALSMVAVCNAQSGGSQHVRFIVLGDDRMRFPREGGPRLGYDNEKSGIDEGVFGSMLSNALGRKPDFVLVTGDLVGGESKDVKDLAAMDGQLAAWLKLVKQRNPKNIPIFAIRGNHETKTSDPAKSWGAVAATTEKYGKRVDKFQTDGFNFGFNFRNVTIVGLDCYRVKSNEAEVDWAKQVLKNKKQYVFAFSHPMLFFTGGHEDHIAGKNRDELLDVLMEANCRAYFAGHDHLYDYARVSREDDRWHGRMFNQYVAGTAGAPFYKADPLPKTDKGEDGSMYKLSRLQHVENTFAFLIVDVDENGCKITPIFFKVPGLKHPSTMASMG